MLQRALFALEQGKPLFRNRPTIRLRWFVAQHQRGLVTAAALHTLFWRSCDRWPACLAATGLPCLSGFFFREAMQPVRHRAERSAACPPSTSPCCSHALRIRLTVCKVVPVISATSCRLIGKSISTPASTFLPACLARRSSACATRCSTCSLDISRTRACVSCRRLPTVCNAPEARAGYLCDQMRPGIRRPGERDAVDGGDGGRRILLQSHGLRDAEQFAGRDVANDDLLSLRRHLFDAKMSVEQQEKDALPCPDRRRCCPSDIGSTALPAAFRPVRRAQVRRTSGRFATRERSREAIELFRMPPQKWQDREPSGH